MYYSNRISALRYALELAGYDDVDAGALDRWLTEFRRGEPVPGVAFHGAIYGAGFSGRHGYSIERGEIREFRALVAEALRDAAPPPPTSQAVRPARHAR